MAFDISGFLLGALAAFGFGILAFLLATNTIKNKILSGKNSGIGMIIGIALVVVGLVGGFGAIIDSEALALGDDVTVDGTQEVTFREVGNSADLNLQGYTGEWGGVGTKTAVNVVMTILNDQGTITSDDTSTNLSTDLNAAVGQTYIALCTGTTYYCDSFSIDVVSTEQSEDVNVYTIPTTANMDIIVYDNTESTALTADDNANNTADYAGGALGAGQTEIYFAKLTTKVADKVFRLGGICTYYCGDEVDDFELTENGWIESGVPSGTMQTAFTHYDDTNATTSCSYKRCYEPSADYVELQEWDWIKYQFTIDTDDTTGPSANGDSYVGAVYMDYACEKNQDGSLACGWFMDTSDKDPGAVGLDENPETTGYNGLDIGFSLEPQ